jgi:GMP synthase - Glutamine amidotransferase domain
LSISTRFKVFHWHGDTFDLPSGAIHLASSGLYQNQAFKYEDRVYALQFHVEVTEDLLSTWFENSPLKERVLSDFQTLKSEGQKTSIKLCLNDYSIIINPRAVTPSANRGVPRRLRASGGQSGGGRRPERSEGCLAIARHDGLETFLNSPIIKSTLGKV